ncbi:hypothetical protein S40288_03540 [Stachybotrys chartarum IBT 40288]|nr:hypothetical protein S40288_03540 [Stachybotrys chartarum IBT 40288]
MPQQSSTIRRRKQRSSGACDFCRRRKLGCDNANPKCENCREHAQTCTYSQRPRAARPSNGRIQALEAENARLRNTLGAIDRPPAAIEIFDGHFTPSTSSTTSPRSNDSNGTITVSVTQPTVSRPRPVEATPESSNTGQAHPPCALAARKPQFHGPSSVMFDEQPVRPQQTSRTLTSTDIQAKNALLAESTRQRKSHSRQMETINLRNGKLDFDGTDPKLAMELLSVFWNRQQQLYPVVYRPAFMRDMARQGPYFSKLLLNAMLLAGAKYMRPPADAQDMAEATAFGKPFLGRFETLLRSTDIFRTSHVTTVQALLIVADTIFSWFGEQSLSWHYMGIAINVLVDLGIHADGSTAGTSGPSTTERVEINRRVFWSAFILDKFQSIYQGRPSRLRDCDNRVPILFLDEHEELEPFSTLTYTLEPKILDSPAYSITTFEQLCKLSVLMDRVFCSLYSEKSSLTDPVELLRVSNSLYQDLLEWRNLLPGHLDIRSDDPERSAILPHTLSLMSMYHSLVILLHRPFVSDGHLQSVAPTAAAEAFSVCATAAFEIDNTLRLYAKKFCITAPPYFISYATYVAATILVRIAAQGRPGSNAHKCLRHCLSVLAEHRAHCLAPRQTIKILIGLVKRLKVDVGDLTAFENMRCQRLASTLNDNLPPQLPHDEDMEVHHTNSAQFGRPGPLPVLQNALDDDLFSFDPTLVEFDMDEIMRTFSNTYNGPAEPVSTSDDFVMPDNLGFDGQDWTTVPDPLFGIGFLNIQAPPGMGHESLS